MKERFYRIVLHMILLLVIILNVVGCEKTKEAESIEPIAKEQVTLVACSDFQHPDGNVSGEGQVRRILRRIKAAGYGEIDGFLCAGDYDYEYEDTAEGILSLKESVKSIYESIDEARMIFAQGNHDIMGSDGLSQLGANDTPEYGVYVIHEDEYPANGGDFKEIEDVAFKLETYLKEKVEKNNKTPIFVISHLPLHYSMRTYNESASLYAEYIFKVLNQYAKEGQNIIYLYGHNHNTWGYDDYIGGSSVYLTKGDTIYIAQIDEIAAYADKSKDVPNERELYFTYMNAGYVGYSNSDNTGADKTLTMTVFHIEGEKVTIERYSSKGLHNLKSKGVWSAYSSENATTYGAEEMYLDKVYESPQTIRQ